MPQGVDTSVGPLLEESSWTPYLELNQYILLNKVKAILLPEKRSNDRLTTRSYKLGVSE